MFYPANYFFNPYFIPPLVAGLMIGMLGMIVFVLERRSLTRLVFCLLTTSAMVWQLSYVGIYCSSNKAIALEWARVELMGVVFIPTLVYLFSLVLTQRLRRFPASAWICFLFSVYFCFHVIFGDRFVSGVYSYFWGYYAKLGPLSIPFLVYFCAALSASTCFLWLEYRKARSERQKKRLKALIAAFGVGYMGSVDYLASYGFPVYPFGYLAVLGFVVLVADTIRRYRLVDLTPEFAAKKILDTMADALLLLDQECLIRVVNPAACRLFGREASEIVGQPISLFERDFFSAERRRAAEVRSIPDYDFSFNRDGDQRTLSVSVTTMKDPGGHTDAFLLIARDITESKKASEALLQKTTELARTNAEREQLKLFAFAASHDLRAPLQKIITFGDILKIKSGVSADPDARHAIERMQNAAQRMGNLIDSLLRFSKASVREEPFEAVDLETAVHDVLSDLETLIVSSGASVELGALPVVYADRAQMYELFQNLVGNALKFHKQGEAPRVSIKSASPDGWSEIVIKDNGVGFDEKYAEKLFKPFERLHGKGEFEGSGLGLAICQKIIQRHGGSIKAHSAPGQGATFTILLPKNP